MPDRRSLSDEILRKQVCHECLQYLSVPNTVVGRHGRIICGRCDSGGQSTKSLYNTVAEMLLFKCRNHHNGCDQILSVGEVEDHEKVCVLEPLECFFCSFSGNISQILHHSLKMHSEHVSLDGVIPFLLNDKTLFKKTLCVLEDKVFMVTLNTKSKDVILNIKIVTTPPSEKITLFTLKFSKLAEPFNHQIMHTDYCFLNVNSESYFKKTKEELMSFFGSENKLCCQILIDDFAFETEYVKLMKRYGELRRAENNLWELKRKVDYKEQKLSRQSESNDAAMDIIKIMSRHFLSCNTCLKSTQSAMFFCSKFHCYCMLCFKNICKICNTQTFKRLRNIEDFLVSCDWPGCGENVKLTDYMNHKIDCSHRRYKCPLPECNEIVLSSEKLVEHWHIEIPKIVASGTITYETYKCEELFWLLKNDLYRILLKFTEEKVEIIIEEVSVFSDDNKLKCEGYVPDCYNDECWKTLTPTDFCGKFQINIANSLTVKDKTNCDANKNITQLKITI